MSKIPKALTSLKAAKAPWLRRTTRRAVTCEAALETAAVRPTSGCTCPPVPPRKALGRR